MKKITIPEDKLIEILSDVHLAEAVIQSMPGLKRDSISEIYYASIFKIHNVTEQEFLESREALLLEPEVADVIYEKIIENLSKSEAKNQTERGQKFRNPVMEKENPGKE